MNKKVLTILILLGLTSVAVSLLLIFGNKNNNNNNNQNNNNKNDEPTISDDSAFDTWKYELPEGWNIEYIEEDDDMDVLFKVDSEKATIYNESIFNIPKISFTGKDKDELFKDSSFFREHFQLPEGVTMEGDGQLIERGGKPVIIFQIKDDEELGNYLVAYMPVDDEFFYYLQFFSTKVIGEKEETFYNYDDLYVFLDFLNSSKKIK